VNRRDRQTNLNPGLTYARNPGAGMMTGIVVFRK
jgi:hypothetical protein